MNKKSVIILGGGISGLTAGSALAEKGFNVTILEKESVLGGLAASFKLENKWIPITYHHIMRPDTITRVFVEKLGFGDEIIWNKSGQAFWYEGKKYLLSQPQHIITFKPLDALSKIKLFKLGILVWFKKNWDDLKDTDTEQWLNKTIGEQATSILFKNLMDIKFNMPLSSVSMAWLGKRLHQSVKNRDIYGYLKCGFHPLVERLAASITEKGGKILTGIEATRIENKRITAVDKENKTHSFEADIIISSIPPLLLAKMADFSSTEKDRLNSISYKPVVSLICGSYNEISKNYWNVFLKPAMSFGGIFNHTALYPQGGLKGEQVYYLFTYPNETDKLYQENEESIKNIYIKDLRKIFPDFKYEWCKVFKIRYSQPVFKKNYENLPVKIKNNIYLTGIYKQFPRPRTMDSAFISGLSTAECIIKENI